MHPKDVRKWVETHVPEIVKPGHLAQLVERTPDKGEVTSSSLVMSTNYDRQLAQLDRAPHYGCGGYRFESYIVCQG